MLEKFCGYCNRFKDGLGFRTILNIRNKSKRGMCPSCQEIRKRPREELEALAKRDSEERKRKR
jgi:hypothetical protein